MSSSIIDTLRRLDGGCLVDRASDELAKVVQAIESTGKPGSITIKLSLKRVGGGALAADGRITCVVPKEAPSVTLLFATPEGSLITEDPNQRKLDLRQVAAELPRELKSINVKG